MVYGDTLTSHLLGTEPPQWDGGSVMGLGGLQTDKHAIVNPTESEEESIAPVCKRKRRIYTQHCNPGRVP